MTDATIVFSTGGSTGDPKYVPLAFGEVLRNAEVHGKGYASAGITATDIVATFGLPGLLSSEFTVYHGLRVTGCRILPIGDVSDPARVIALIRELAANVLLVMPSDLFPLLEVLEERNERLEAIRLVVTGGEALSAMTQASIARRIGTAATRFRSTFQSCDAGTIGFQCELCARDEYHVHEELQDVEIAGDEGAVGELVVTNLDRRVTPVVKMRTGDRAEWVDGACPCGRAQRKLRLLGRIGPEFKVGGEKLAVEAFVELRKRLGLADQDLAATITRAPSGRDRVTIHISWSARELTVARIRAGLRQCAPILVRQLEAGVLEPLEVELIERERTFRSPTGKWLILRDLR